MADPAMPRAEWEALAAELALGVLEGDDRARALRLCLSDPEFAAEVARWEARLAGLLDDAGEVSVPPALWAAIEGKLRPATPTASIRTLRLWQGGALASGAVAAALALMLLTRPAVSPTPAPTIVTAAQPVIVASLTGGAEGPRFDTRYDPGAARLKVRAAATPPAMRVPELWVIPEDGVPRSLGYVAASGETDLPIAEGHRSLMRDGVTLAITWEPPAAEPHAAPSGAPVATGRIATL